MTLATLTFADLGDLGLLALALAGWLGRERLARRRPRQKNVRPSSLRPSSGKPIQLANRSTPRRHDDP